MQRSSGRPTRREALTRLVAAAAAGAGLGASAGPSAAEGTQPSGAVARVPFGAAVQTHLIEKEAQYRDAVLAHCQQIVPEGALKWVSLRPRREAFTFEEADALVAFAKANGLAIRGHTLVWYAAMPDWTKEISSAAEAERELVTHIERVVSRYKGVIKSWDVVNEPIADHPRSRSDLRPSVWLQHLGPRYIDIALRTAAAVDPEAQLVINDFDIETGDRKQRRRREALLALMQDLKSRGLPLHAVGFQGHLHGEVPIDMEAVSRLVADFKGMGLDVLVTELDVIDWRLPGPIEERDRAVARRAHDFLSAIFAAATPTALLAWGVTDRYTWVPMYFKRADGQKNRPLPLDADYQRKPLLDVIEHFCRRAV